MSGMNFIPNAQILTDTDDISMFGFRFPDSNDDTLPNKFGIEIDGFEDIISDIGKIIDHYTNWELIKV